MELIFINKLTVVYQFAKHHEYLTTCVIVHGMQKDHVIVWNKTWKAFPTYIGTFKCTRNNHNLLTSLFKLKNVDGHSQNLHLNEHFKFRETQDCIVQWRCDSLGWQMVLFQNKQLTRITLIIYLFTLATYEPAP